jgi:superfamily II DNA or RNA helicase
MDLRHYQQQAVDAVLGAFDQGHQTTLVVIPTGGGKTVMAAHIAKAMIEKGRVMVLVHREELLQQAAQKFRRIAGIHPAIEKAESFSPEEGLHGKPPIVIGSVQTLNSGDEEARRLHRFDPAEFSFLWVDEAHHAVAPTWRRCLEHFRQNPDIRILLTTATPDRADERGLAELCDHVAFDYELSDIIRDGYLVPIRQRRVFIEGLEFTKIHTVGGDFDQHELEAAMLAEQPLHGIVHATIETACGLEIGYLETIRDRSDRQQQIQNRLAGRPPRKALMFAVSVSHAERSAEILNRWIPYSARAISGSTPPEERRRLIAAYAAGEFCFLCNCDIAREGFDEPSIELVIMARPTKSRTVYAQAIGRGTRPAAEIADELGKFPDAESRRKLIAGSSKKHVEILDFVGNSGRHKLVCTADLLGTAKPDSIVERAAELATADGIDMSEALLQAEDEDNRARAAQAAMEELEAEEADARDEAQVIAAARRRMLVATASYRTEHVSAFDQADRGPVTHNPNGATPKQIDFLRKLGVPADTAASYGRRQASAVIDDLKSRRCTEGQAWALRRHGYTKEEIEAMNFDAASKAIDEARNGAAA